MSIFAHTLLTYAGVKYFQLQGTDVWYAYIFGVAIDADHIIKFPLYYRKNRLGIVKHYNWRTSLQEPVALLWIVPFAMLVTTFTPVVFFCGHLLLDYLMRYPKRPFFPYSSFQTRGLFPGISDKVKEGVVIVLALCLILLLK